MTLPALHADTRQLPCGDRAANQVLAERLQWIARGTTVAFLVAWGVWFFPFDDSLDRRGTPLGADYAMFYAAGRSVLDGAADRLYDQAAHQQRLAEIFPKIDRSFSLPYRYPPCVALLAAPLAALPYPLSFGLFFLSSSAAWCAAVWLAVRDLPALCGPWRRAVLWGLAGWPVAWETLFGGQASTFAALFFSSALALIRRRRFAAAGVALAMAAYKPNVLAVAGLGLLLRYPRLLRGLLPAAAGLVLLSLVPGGWAALRDYGELACRLAAQPWDVETPHWKVHGLAVWLAALPGGWGRISSLAAGIAAAAAVAWQWRRSRVQPLAFAWASSLLISINALCNPYTPIYDLLLLSFGALLVAEALAAEHGADISGRRGTAELLLAAVYFGPHLSQGVAQAAGFQPFPAVLLGISLWQARQLVRLGSPPVPQLTRQPAWPTAG